MKIYFKLWLFLFLCSNFAFCETEGDSKPKIIKCKRPEFPVEALASRHTGKVSVLLSLDIRGRVRKAEIISSSGYSDLDAAAKKAYLRCIFSPEFKNGTPLESTFIMNVDWSFVN